MAIRILIADDYGLMRRALRGVIESHEGWEVCGDVEDGDEAVTKAAELRPDAIILDLIMPRMDGLEAARRILKAAPSVPIILHTLHHTAELDRAAQVMGIYKVTSKTNTVDLVVELERLFRGRATPSPTEPFGTPRVSPIDR
jgi:DNA-binding NarL/FixJ family response regulator